MKWVVAFLHLTAAIQVGPEGAIREKNATQAALEAFGSAKCPCVGFADVNGVTMALVGESYVAYPGDLGSSCQPWDQNRNPECREGEGRKSWCKQPWCYVDARKCDLEVVPTLSKYLPSARFQNMPLFYSYDTCGVETPKIDQDPVDGCKCIGIDHRAGSFAVSLDDGLVQYPAELGGSCQAWDAHLHPLCAAGRPPEFFQQKWCYVDPCKCTVKSPPKEALYFNATMRGKSIYYSYEACGFKDAFTPSFSKNACVNAKDEKECGLLPKCAWSGSTCLGKELVVPELCSLEKEAYNGTKVEDLRSFCGSAVLSSFLLTVLSIFNL